MKLTFNLLEVLAKIFSDLQLEYDLDLSLLTEDSATLRSKNYEIFLGIDYDGIYASYFGKDEKLGYDLLGFLLECRRDRLIFAKIESDTATHKDYAVHQFSALARHLHDGSPDILAGEVTWKKSYRLPKLSRPGI
ncbi:hypothetical protein [Pseudoduganella lurida]|uniref:hypothetical protein n=1 Tax=Pseudoduganella lurida TaxID=1036180 RepID=UPI00119D7698|nr:hypothetical protein [Pseudoduganella lurida]